MNISKWLLLLLLLALSGCGSSESKGGDRISTIDSGGMAAISTDQIRQLPVGSIADYDPVISVIPANLSIAAGATQQFTASALLRTFPISIDIVPATWSSSAPSVAQISNSGQVTAIAAGTTTITATLDGIAGSTTLTVVAQ